MLESADSEHSGLSNREIIFEDFQLMWSLTIPQRHGQTDERTERPTICRSNTALCVASRGKNNKICCRNSLTACHPLF